MLSTILTFFASFSVISSATAYQANSLYQPYGGPRYYPQNNYAQSYAVNSYGGKSYYAGNYGKSYGSEMYPPKSYSKKRIPEDCLARRRAMDTSVKRVIMLTNPRQVLYQNEHEMFNDYCIKLNHRLDIISNYKPCLKSFPYHLFNMAVRDMKQNARKVCSTPNERHKMVNSLKCFTRETYPKVVQLGYQTTSLLDYMSTVPDGQKIVPAMCCGYRLIGEDAKVTIDDLCREQGIGPSGLRYFQSIAIAAGANTLDTVCRNYRDVEECEFRIPDTVRELRTLFDQTKGRKYRYTPITSLLNVIDRIDRENSTRSNNFI